MMNWKLVLAPIVFGVGYLVSSVLLESTGNPDHAKFVRLAIARVARNIASELN